MQIKQGYIQNKSEIPIKYVFKKWYIKYFRSVDFIVSIEIGQGVQRWISGCCNIQDGALSDNSKRLPAINYYHKPLDLGCCSSPRSASGVVISSSVFHLFFFTYIFHFTSCLFFEADQEQKVKQLKNSYTKFVGGFQKGVLSLKKN